MADPPFLREPSLDGETMLIGDEPDLAVGVAGYWMLDDYGTIWLPLIEAHRPGSGDVGRFLDALPCDRRIVVPSVMSPVLAGMLERRQFVCESPRFGATWVRDARGSDG